MIVFKLLTATGDWAWTVGVVWWLVNRPLEGPWYR